MSAAARWDSESAASRFPTATSGCSARATGATPAASRGTQRCSRSTRHTSPAILGREIPALQVRRLAGPFDRRLPHHRQLHADQDVAGSPRSVLRVQARNERQGRWRIGFGRPGLSHGGRANRGAPVYQALDAAATFAAQSGRYGRDTVRAYGASGKAGFTLATAWEPRIGGQYTWGSGDSNPTDGIHGTFDGVYGGRDIFFYGYLNLFFWANLRDAEFDLRVTPHRTLTGFVELHQFSLDRPADAWYTTGLKPYRRDPTGRSGTDLGQELDLRLVWNPSSHLELMVALGYFVPGRFVDNTGPASSARWLSAQAVTLVKPPRSVERWRAPDRSGVSLAGGVPPSQCIPQGQTAQGLRNSSRTPPPQ